MPLLRSRRSLVGAVVALLAISATWMYARTGRDTTVGLMASAKQGAFKVLVTTSGELRARKFVQITAPPQAMQAQIFQMKIATLVPEGTEVKAGDVVATLDRAAIQPKVSDARLNVQKAEATYQQAMLDSTLTLSKAREDIQTQELQLEQKKIVKEQSIYEAPSIQRQAELDYEQADRALTQSKANYKTQTLQAQAKMSEAGADLERQKNQLKLVEQVMAGFTIRAPSAGMVIYIKNFDGQKRSAGSPVYAYDPGVATLPDLTKMESVTYINEVDVRKVAVGQKVTISLDADPTKTLPGTVVSVATVGEQRPNSDAKVFEVHINVDKPDTTLRPGMTTGNAILTAEQHDVVYVPIEAVTTDSGVPIVYKSDGGTVVRQEVQTGAMNDDDVVIAQGLAAGDKVLLTPPENPEHLRLVRLPGSRVRAPAPGGDTSIPAHPSPPAPAKPGRPAAPDQTTSSLG